MNEKMKIGSGLRALEDDILTSMNGETVQVLEGDEAYVDSRGIVHYLTGEARETVQKVFDAKQMVGYDHTNIAEMLVDKLEERFTVVSMLEDEGIDVDDVIIEMIYMLQDIL